MCVRMVDVLTLKAVTSVFVTKDSYSVKTAPGVSVSMKKDCDFFP